eukprot:XP_011426289.1 PREDICTED: uncharacterized protein LOC105327482 [Crassostrea gigas]
MTMTDVSFSRYIRRIFAIFCFILISKVLSEQPNLRDLCPRDIAIDPKYVWTYGSVCLQLSMDKHDWPHARERCQRHGGDLVQIRTADMQGSIIEKIRQSHSHIKTGFWIGASDQHHEGLWQWVSGDKTMTYDNWSPHQGPHQTGFLLIHGGSTEDCGLMKVNDNYMWHDYPCHSGIAFFYPYICQFDIPKTTSSMKTTAKTTLPTTTKSTTVTKATTIKQMTTSTPKPTTWTTRRTSLNSTPSTRTIGTGTPPTSTRSTLQHSTILSILTSKSQVSGITEERSMLVNKTTLTTPANNRPTTDEWEALITAKSPQDRRTTTTKEESHADGVIIIG